jgi:A/G-specific adenine glycosylase
MTERKRWEKARKALAAWYEAARRDLPWRRTRDPYRVWLSEVMLQQTRVAAAVPYYERFLAKFPTVEALAEAEEAELLTAWSGLGYYARARNLRRAAREIAARGFPETYEGWLELPGVGGYTAAAVASIVYGVPRAVVDGNVMRVVARLIGDAGDIGSARTKKRFGAVAQEFLDARNPARHNQAVMELGAVVCVPREPRCGECPVAAWCVARREGRERELPVKLREKRKVEVALRLAVVERGGAVQLRRREEAGRMRGFWELPEAEAVKPRGRYEIAGNFAHAILHIHYRVEVALLRGRGEAEGCAWIPLGELARLPLATMTKKALDLAGIIYK